MNKIYANVTEDDLVDLPNFQWVVLASEAEEREAAFQEELSMVRKAVPNSTLELASLKHRLTVAEQLMQEFCDRVDRGEVRSKTTYGKFKAALKPAAEGV